MERFTRHLCRTGSGNTAFSGMRAVREATLPGGPAAMGGSRMPSNQILKHLWRRTSRHWLRHPEEITVSPSLHTRY